MSTHLTPPPHLAPWLPTLKSHLKTLLPDSPEFVLSTLSHIHNNNQSRTPQPQPRARYCIHRSFWCDDLPIHTSTLDSIRESGKEKEEVLNPSPGVYESEGLTFTTDVRMEKVGELGGGGGGRDVEAVFWVKGCMSQWRVRGKGYVIGGEGGEEEEERARGEVKRWMRRRGDREGDWSWEKEVTGHFANLSPVMRGSFKNPPPGTPKPKPTSSEPAPKLGEQVHDLHDPIARKNFRVVVILPEVVEWVDLTTAEEARRLRWTLTSSEEGARWDEVELWP